MKFTSRMSSWPKNTKARKWVVQSVLITLLTWFAGPTPAAAQGLTAQPAIVYVTNTDGGVSEINEANNSVIATAPFVGIGAVTAVAPNGKRMYVTDYLSANVTVLDTGTNVPVAQIPVGSGTGNIGVAVTPDGAEVFVTSQFDGIVTVIATATNTVVKTIATGAEPVQVMISADGSRAYVSNQASGTVSVIATASNHVVGTISGLSCPYHTHLIHYDTQLLVASACDNTLKVVSTATNTVVKSIPTGLTPSGIAVTADETRAYVSDYGANTVDVIDLYALANLGTPIAVGTNPRGMAMGPNGKIYVANFGGTTVSVIDSTTNQVIGTLNVRGGPAEVTVSTTARPRILKYKFVGFDVPGAVSTICVAMNDRGQSVGRFQDAAGVEHGFLRQPDGSFLTIDVPGSVLTGAFGINDTGIVVGQWQAASGALHGFTRSPSGTLSTLDFPGAADSQVFGINLQGTLVGNYDLGDMNTSIGFEDIRGAFTSFEDPAAAPLSTTAVAINMENFISGFYNDAVTSHGFVRDSQGQFHNFDFPGADSTAAARINDLGQVAGIYTANSPFHGFILSGAMDLSGPPLPRRFFSFDYPDSRASASRGINDLGQVVGSYTLFGSRAQHGFLATPSFEQGENNDE